jgi:hypothetical protein
MAIGPIQLLRQATTEQRRTLLAAALGWMLDAFDAMLYALGLAHVMRDLGMSKATSGLLYTLTRKMRSPHCLHCYSQTCRTLPLVSGRISTARIMTT